jgi:hypothetical protein
VEIVGIENGSCGKSCEEHDICGNALYIDAVVRFRCIQVVNGKWFQSDSHVENAF